MGIRKWGIWDERVIVREKIKKKREWEKIKQNKDFLESRTRETTRAQVRERNMGESSQCGGVQFVVSLSLVASIHSKQFPREPPGCTPHGMDLRQPMVWRQMSAVQRECAERTFTCDHATPAESFHTDVFLWNFKCKLEHMCMRSDIRMEDDSLRSYLTSEKCVNMV